MRSDRNLLIIGSVWPEPDSSAAGRRMTQLISLFQQDGWKVTFASAAGETSQMADLGKWNVEKAGIEINNSDFDEFVADLQPSAVMFDRFIVEEQFGWRIARHAPDALRVLDTEDLHCLRRARRKAVSENRFFSTEELLSSDVAKREVASILRCDLSLIISEFEVELLKNIFQVDESLLHYLPFLPDSIDAAVMEGWPGFQDRSDFVTVGNFRHPPNLDAAIYLKEKIWPRIRAQLSSAKMLVYGAYPTETARRLHQPAEGFHIKGRTRDAQAVVQKARICLAPLRFGAGLKGKLLEAMRCGTPSVTTGIGAEGIKGEMEWCGAVAYQPHALASAAVELYNDRPAWERAQRQGARIHNSRFSQALFKDRLKERIACLGNNLIEHRRRNFTGSMLMHHSMASTKYMSRWIEAKNKGVL